MSWTRFRTESVRKAQSVWIANFKQKEGNSIRRMLRHYLQKVGIPVQMNVREGDIVIETLDVADQIECNEIGLPIPY
jgi:hypothetical protein